MPGWHDATQALQEQGRIRMVGIVQEQHPDRARLFMQWKQMGWPILVDPLNLLEVTAVPLTFAIDEHGIVRHAKLPVAAAGTIEEAFVSRTYDADDEGPPPATLPDLDALRAAAAASGADAWESYANALVMWGGTGRLGDAIDAYETTLASAPDDAFAHFRLGVAHRQRYDSSARGPEDFQRAVEHWTRALDLDPNQYIFRRRIQQFGPRLNKPYPFYDWVPVARREIAARGETPVALVTEPGEGEYAEPSKEFTSTATPDVPADPQGRILRDRGEFVGVELAVVPPAVTAGDPARVHVTFRPNLQSQAHWNNEVDGLALWIEPPPAWAVDRRSQLLRNPPEVVSQEPRVVEFEVRPPASAGPGVVTVPAYALYYVCEDVNGVCLYRRQDLDVRIPVVGQER